MKESVKSVKSVIEKKNKNVIMIQRRIYSYFERNPQLHVLFIFDWMNIFESGLEGKEWADG